MVSMRRLTAVFHRACRGALAGLAALALVQSAALAQSFPARPVRLIVPVAAGGGTDILGRVLAEKLGEAWSQPVVVENRPGGGFVLGTSIAAKAPADGYTAIIVGLPHVVNPSLHASLPYDNRDFEPVMMLAHIPIVAAVHADFPARTLQELVDAARAKPGALSFASTGLNASGHLAGEQLKLAAKIDMQHIPYKGSAPALQDVLGGRVPIIFDALLTVEPHIRAGKLRALAVTTPARASALREVPTTAEAGYPDVIVSAWLGLLVPARTPEPILDIWNGAVARALAAPEVRERLLKQGWEIMPYGTTRRDFAAFLQNEQARWATLVRAAGLKAQQP